MRFSTQRRWVVLGALALVSACEQLPSPFDPDFGVTAVAVTPSAYTLQVNDSVQLTATVVMSNNRPPRAVNWSSSNAAIVRVGSTGVAGGVAPGSVFVVATSGSKRDSAGVTVLPPVAAVILTPNIATLRVGHPFKLSAIALDAAGNTLSGCPIAWSTSAPGVAGVDSTGLVTALSPGSATINATSETKSSTAALTVTLVPVASVLVSPPAATLRVATSVQLSATPLDSAGNPLTGRVVTWSSSAPGVATVNSSGLVTAVGLGLAAISATSETKSGATAITVTTVPVATVVLSPAAASVQVGGTVQLTPTTKDSAGNTLSGRVAILIR